MFNPQIVKQQIENLKLVHPELADDDWELSLESETNLNELLTSIVRQIDDSKALVIGTRERFEELAARKKRFEDRIEALRELAFRLMQSAEIGKVELPIATLSLRAVPAAVVITDEENLPDIACKFERKPDKTKIKELLATGPVAGASMGNGSIALSIRVK